MESVAGRLASWLESRGDIPFHRDGASLNVEPLEGGFPVQIEESAPGEWTVHYGVWHEEFEDAERAMRCFAWGLTTACRLKVEMAGESAHKWSAEVQIDGEWLLVSVTGLLVWPMWRRSRTAILQNRYLSIGDLEPWLRG